MDDSGEPVSHNDGSSTLTHLHQRRLDVSLCLSVKCRSGFIKQDNSRGFEDCPRNAHSLFLSTAQFESSLSYHSRVLLRERENSLMDVSITCCLLHLFITRLRVAWQEDSILSSHLNCTVLPFISHLLNECYN